MRVLGFGTYDVRVHPRVGILLDGLRAHGVGVAEVNAPLGVSTAERVAALGSVSRLPRLAARLLRRWATLVRLARRAPRPDAVLVGYLGHLDVLLAAALFRRVPVVLDYLVSGADTARDRRQAGRVRLGLLQALDTAALAAAEVVVVDTAEHLDLLPARYRNRAVVAPVGAAAVWRPSPRPADPGPLRVIFFGVYTPLQGAPVIGAALGLLADEPGVVALMIGAGQDLAATRAAAAGNPRVRWERWVDADRLPGLVSAYDVCLGIFGTTPKAQRVVPNKVFQGAAAGCAVVTSDTPPQRRLLGDAAVLVPPGDPEALAGALRELAADREKLAGLRAAAARLADTAFRPPAVAAPLLTRLEELTA